MRIAGLVRVRRVNQFEVFSLLALCLFGFQSSSGQVPTDESKENDFVKATVAAHNIEESLTEHLANDPDFKVSLQIPEDKRELPSLLVRKDGTFDFDWTLGQHARYLMEKLRQGIHQLQSLGKHKGIDQVAQEGARASWPKMRDISCGESPGVRFFDLDGFERYCPEHK